MEYWDVYDRDRIKTGKKVKRGNKSYGNSNLLGSEYHLVVHICIFNSNNQMLIQKRQSSKETLANLWDISAAGSALFGETSYEAAQREVSEELGYAIDLSGKREHLSINFDRGFDDFYLINEDIDLDSLTLQKEEVQAVKWAKEEDILKLIDEGEFVPYYKDLIRLLFSMKDRPLGSHSKNI